MNGAGINVGDPLKMDNWVDSDKPDIIIALHEN
ncbi:MAG: hypothetical protein JWM59_2397 [Verrucomicrobiales bacterium]|nr:hypothetical protein [Verrucomicrobiales bacterium]